jgi:nucleotide-binding universal stress UspA family protein
MSDTPNRILVGFDGSEESKRALRWAVDLAALIHAEVHAFHAWDFPSNYDFPYAFQGWDPAVDPQREFDAAVQEIDTGRRPDRLTLKVVRGDPARVLIEESHRATMLVVGSRGLGGFATLMMGSVSAKCARHSACPVLVMHGAQNLYQPSTGDEPL